MPWEVFKRDDSSLGRDEPFVAISSGGFLFNAVLVRLAEIGIEKQVTIHVDSQNRKLGFEFHDEKRITGFAIYGGGRKQTIKCAIGALLKKHAWVRSVTQLPPKDRRFTPRREGHLWVIQLCPAFEERKARESAEIPSGIRGVYRYLRENGEIVYIGRGDIKSRLASPERVDWDFDRIEYSVVPDPDQQVRWEDYWLNRYKEENGGRLPFYNKVSGISSKADEDVEESAEQVETVDGHDVPEKNRSRRAT